MQKNWVLVIYVRCSSPHTPVGRIQHSIQPAKVSGWPWHCISLPRDAGAPTAAISHCGTPAFLLLFLFLLSLCNPGEEHLLSKASVPGEGPLISLALRWHLSSKVETQGCITCFIIMISFSLNMTSGRKKKMVYGTGIVILPAEVNQQHRNICSCTVNCYPPSFQQSVAISTGRVATTQYSDHQVSQETCIQKNPK